MPLMNGHELTSGIRKRNTNIAVIALTADAFTEQAVNCLSAA
jgi:CheY-like chemotaxis protein